VRQIPTALLLLFLTSARAAEVDNGGFESGLSGWKQLWTREPSAGVVSVDQNVFHGGRQGARIEHMGQQD
jgi:hypothetical protein